ncbi:hypothetical protein [Clostridium massiliamazoniense]|uniref:hypothetical protein n=1 Tax=Clostridium massiliamazoniense TaxID=1347366 RepID=UPI0006D79E36|nr:hypothetical protein [Clostridium massiliamazoniense]
MNLCEFNYSKVLTTLQQLKDVNSKINNTLDELNRILESEEELKFIGERLYYTNIDLRKNIINISNLVESTNKFILEEKIIYTNYEINKIEQISEEKGDNITSYVEDALELLKLI